MLEISLSTFHTHVFKTGQGQEHHNWIYLISLDDHSKTNSHHKKFQDMTT